VIEQTEQNGSQRGSVIPASFGPEIWVEREGMSIHFLIACEIFHK
jgi:hypothetical protein